jgi:ketosteroid isomerase-like protein
MKRLILILILILGFKNMYSQNHAKNKTIKSAKQLLQAYHSNINIHNLDAVASLFATDGAVELPYLASLGQPWRTEGPENIKNMFTGLFKMAPDFKFINIKYYIETPDQVFAEYEVDCLFNGKPYKQLYMGRLVAEKGKIKLLREALNLYPIMKLGE